MNQSCPIVCPLFGQYIQQQNCLLSRNRLADEVALCDIAAAIGNALDLRIRFHTLRDDFKTQSVCQKDDHIDNIFFCFIGRNFIYETLIDFHGVYRQILQVSE